MNSTIEYRLANHLCRQCGGPTPEGTTRCPTCKEQQRQDAARRSAERKAAGICRQCGEPAMPGYVRCATCNAAHAAHATATAKPHRINVTYEARKAAGLCVQCGDPIPEGSVRKSVCDPCAKRCSEASKRRRDKNRAAGGCSMCGAPPVEGTTLCPKCTGRAAVHSHEWRERRKADATHCMYCAEPRWAQATACKFHYVEKKVAAYGVPKEAIPALLARFDEQGGKCFYTGQPLVPGVNASLDHFRSVKLHPELAADPDNLVWVDTAVNNSKRETPPAEFVEMCKRVVANEAKILAGTPVLPLPASPTTLEATT